MKKSYSPTVLSAPVLGFLIAIFHCSATPAWIAPVYASEAKTSDASAPDGEKLFHEKGCEHCHGIGGVGIPGKAPSLLTVGKRLSKEAIARQIQDGGKNMPAFGASLQPDEINALVKALAKKKKAPKLRSVTASPTV